MQVVTPRQVHNSIFTEVHLIFLRSVLHFMKVNQNSHATHPKLDSSIFMPSQLFPTPASPAVPAAVLSLSLRS